MRTMSEVHEAGEHDMYPPAGCPLCSPLVKIAEAERYEALAADPNAAAYAVNHYEKVAAKYRKGAAEVWPTHPDGRTKKMGELTREEQMFYAKVACDKLKKEMESPEFREALWPTGSKQDMTALRDEVNEVREAVRGKR